VQRADDLEIRDATVEDAAGIARVYVQTWRAAYAGILPATYLRSLTVERLAKVWSKSIAEGELVLVASAASEVLAFTSGGRERDMDPFFLGEIATLYVDVALQRHGLGATLLFEMLRRVPSPVIVRVLEQNHAGRAFYEAFGGVPVRRETTRVGGAALPVVAYAYFDVG
jgi:L-amino acid N-acyltransferase YncA